MPYPQQVSIRIISKTVTTVEAMRMDGECVLALMRKQRRSGWVHKKPSEWWRTIGLLAVKEPITINEALDR
jgi:hypothetical protein